MVVDLQRHPCNRRGYWQRLPASLGGCCGAHIYGLQLRLLEGSDVCCAWAAAWTRLER